MSYENIYILGPEAAGNHLARDVVCYLLGVKSPECMGHWSLDEPLPEREHPAVWAGSIPSAGRWQWPWEVHDRLGEAGPSGVIVIRRDWLATAKSQVERRAAGTLENGFKYIHEADVKIAQFIEEYCLPYRVVQYEGLCEAPQLTANMLARALGVPSRDMAEFPGNPISSGNTARFAQLREEGEDAWHVTRKLRWRA